MKCCSDQVYRLAQEVGRGGFLNFRFKAGAWYCESWAVVAHCRGVAPRMVVLASCTLNEQSCLLSVDTLGDIFNCLLCVSFLGLFFKQAPPGEDVEVFCSPVTVERKGMRSVAVVLVRAGWSDEVRQKQRQVFPVRSSVRPSVDPALRKMRAGLKKANEACEDLRLPRTKLSANRSGVRVVRPLPPQAAGDGRDRPDSGLDRERVESTDAESEQSEVPGHTSSDESGGDNAPDAFLGSVGSSSSAPLPSVGNGVALQPAPESVPQPVPHPAPQPEPLTAPVPVIDGIVREPPQNRRGAPWRAWAIGTYGWIVLDEVRGSLGAHCNIRCHGFCRANKTLKRFPLGYLVAWLRAGHGEGIRTRRDHVQLQERLLSVDGWSERQRAREWLTGRAGDYADLLALEGESVEEPLCIRR